MEISYQLRTMLMFQARYAFLGIILTRTHFSIVYKCAEVFYAFSANITLDIYSFFEESWLKVKIKYRKIR